MDWDVPYGVEHHAERDRSMQCSTSVPSPNSTATTTKRPAGFTQAADAGSSAAMFVLGAVASDRGGEDEARAWYTRAVDAGSTEAMTNLGMLAQQRGDIEEAIFGGTRQLMLARPGS